MLTVIAIADDPMHADFTFTEDVSGGASPAAFTVNGVPAVSVLLVATDTYTATFIGPITAGDPWAIVDEIQTPSNGPICPTAGTLL